METHEGTFTDHRDGRVYKTVRIGGHVWMAENLAYAAKDSRFYERNVAYKEYGRLYNWNSAMKYCPAGWHLPSKEEWKALVDSVGGAEVAGKVLKAKTGWNFYEGMSGGTDDYGFAALPGGVGSSDSNFFNLGFSGYWWTASDYHGSDYAYRQYMNYGYKGALDNLNVKSYFLSVRCVRN